MTLTAALKIAQSSLFNVSQQTSLTSRNISEADNENYVKRQARVATTEYGARVYSVGRAEVPALFRDSVNALSDSAAQGVIADTAGRLRTIVNGVDNQASPATKLDALRQALQVYSTDPSNTVLGGAAADAARELATAINTASQGIQDHRARLDRDIASGVARLGELLAQFEQVNTRVVEGTRMGRDVNDDLDQRDTLIKQMSEFVSVSVMERGDNDVVLFAGQGIMLFETVARDVTFEPKTAYAPGMTGNTLRIDGVPLVVGQGANTSASGTLSAMIQARDTMAGQAQAQLDEVARGLVAAFAETDQTGGGAPDRAGLFTHAGGPAIPAAGTLAPGLSLTLSVNAAYDPLQGGDAARLRDGGANGPAYLANASGGVAFADNLIALIGRLDTPLATDAAAGIAGDKSVTDYARASIGWIEGQRQTAERASEAKLALHQKLSGDYLEKTGVSVDEEMTKLIALEQSYDASARIMAVVGQMLDNLMAAVR
ncbi:MULTISPECIES: flagellar hook-associated protein FlgK [unclassified Roseitalea]|uniref:flagellar hook-associated protein FlgK n=1 Tax=unclassified Roseitalea TaxID=2639107 RepID=UPI00273D3937|nr:MULTISPECIES: flagellar hook-associated protein FlgK [unclassified Roseitalea]